MKGQPGHKSKSPRIMVTPKRWAAERQRLMAKIPKDLTAKEAGVWLDRQMKAMFRMRTRRKR